MAAYIKFDGIDGECIKDEHKAWIECSSFSWGASNPSNVGMSSGAAKGSVMMGEINISCNSGKSTLLLLHFCTLGKHFDKVEIEVTKATGDKSTEKTWQKITLKQAMITGFNQSNSEYDSSESVAIAFGEYEHEVWAQDDKGALKSGGVHGLNLQTGVAK